MAYRKIPTGITPTEFPATTLLPGLCWVTQTKQRPNPVMPKMSRSSTWPNYRAAAVTGLQAVFLNAWI